MPKPKSFTYEKKAPYRDAFLFIIVCEGTNRELKSRFPSPVVIG
jgi:hypothetical protein